MLEFKTGKVPTLIDTGAQFSCIRSDVAKFLQQRGEPCRFVSCSVACLLANGQRCELTEAVKLHVKLSFSWDHEFKILSEGPFPVILGLDFMKRTGMLLDMASRTSSFGFSPGCSGVFCLEDLDVCEGGYLQHLRDEVRAMTSLSEPWPGDGSFGSLVAEFPALFSSTLGVAKCAPYEIELSDPTPVRSSPYRCAPPKLKVFREMVDDLLEKGAVT
jgi:hypothetical protein